MEAPETPHGPGTGVKGMAAGVLAMALGCAMLAFCFAFSSNVQWRRAKALQEDATARHKLATSFFLKGHPHPTLLCEKQEWHALPFYLRYTNVPWQVSRAPFGSFSDLVDHPSLYSIGAPEWAISSTLARTQSSYKATKSSAKAKEEEGSSEQVTIKVVSYPSEWFSGYHLLTEDGWFGYLLEK